MLNQFCPSSDEERLDALRLVNVSMRNVSDDLLLLSPNLVKLTRSSETRFASAYNKLKSIHKAKRKTFMKKAAASSKAVMYAELFLQNMHQQLDKNPELLNTFDNSTLPPLPEQERVAHSNEATLALFKSLNTFYAACEADHSPLLNRIVPAWSVVQYHFNEYKCKQILDEQLAIDLRKANARLDAARRTANFCLRKVNNIVSYHYRLASENQIRSLLHTWGLGFLNTKIEHQEIVLHYSDKSAEQDDAA